MAEGSGLGDAVEELRALADRLRRECPWDRVQTERTIVPHTIEEAYEVADAALSDDDAKLLDELGDLLFQVVFLCTLLEERGAGSLRQVIGCVHAKLVRRHPHVFGDTVLESPREVRASWEAIKVAQEGRQGIFHDVPGSLPGLLRARKLQQRAAQVGFDYQTEADATAGLDHRIAGLRDALSTRGLAEEREPDTRVFSEFGDTLFALVSVARKANVDPELAVVAASRRFTDRIDRASGLARADGEEFASLAPAEQDRYFTLAAAREADD